MKYYEIRERGFLDTGVEITELMVMKETEKTITLTNGTFGHRVNKRELPIKWGYSRRDLITNDLHLGIETWNANIDKRIQEHLASVKRNEGNYLNDIHLENIKVAKVRGK